MIEQYIQSEMHDLYMHKIYKHERILDIGGGGEGVIGKLYGKQVIAIDKLEKELVEVDNDALNIIMDARNTGFMKDSFDVCTLFYSLFYMTYEDKKAVLKEAFRVLDHGGILEIWDVDIPKPEAGKIGYIANLNIHIDDITLKTGYGTGFKGEHHFEKVVYDLCLQLGYEPIMRESRKGHFHMKFMKFDPIIGRLRKKLMAYNPKDEKEIEDRRLMLDFISDYRNHFSRGNIYGHFTGSAWIVNQDYNKILFTHHGKLDMWVQLGGHVDPGESIENASLREAKEESGLDNIMLIDDAIYDIDAHLIPERGDMPAHYHFDVRFAFVADDRAPLLITSESKDLKWISVDEVRDYNNEHAIRRMLHKTKGLYNDTDSY